MSTPADEAGLTPATPADGSGRLGGSELDLCPACEKPVGVEDNFVYINRRVLHLRCALKEESPYRLGPT